MRQLKIFLLLLVINFHLSYGQSQECYKVIANMDTFEPSPNQNELENAACALVEAFPLDFQDQFKVFEVVLNSKDRMDDKIITEYDKGYFSLKTDYNLVFGREVDDNGDFINFWFRLDLPSEGCFECIDLIAPGYLNILSNKLENNFLTTYKELGQTPSTYSTAMIASMDSLKCFISNTINCKGTNPSSDSFSKSCFSIDQLSVNCLEQEDFIKLKLQQIQLFDTEKYYYKENEYSSYDKEYRKALDTVMKNLLTHFENPEIKEWASKGFLQAYHDTKELVNKDSIYVFGLIMPSEFNYFQIICSTISDFDNQPEYKWHFGDWNYSFKITNDYLDTLGLYFDSVTNYYWSSENKIDFGHHAEFDQVYDAFKYYFHPIFEDKMLELFKGTFKIIAKELPDTILLFWTDYHYDTLQRIVKTLNSPQNSKKFFEYYD